MLCPRGAGRLRQHSAVLLPGTRGLGGPNQGWHQTPFSSRTLIRGIGAGRGVEGHTNFTLSILVRSVLVRRKEERREINEQLPHGGI